MKIILVLLFPLLAIQTMAQQQAIEEAIHKKEYEKYGKPGEDKLNQFLSGNLMNVTPLAEYSFPVSVTQHIVTYNNGKVKSETDMKYYINSETKTFALDGSSMEGSKKKTDTKMISVYDNTNSAMLLFNLTEKSLFAMNLNAFRSRESIEASKNAGTKTPASDGMNCGKTGKTKTIMGYSCYEYVCRKEGAKSHTAMWINSDVKMGDVPFMAGRAPSYYGKNYGIEGSVLGIDTYNDNDELTASMTVTAINQHEDLKLVTADFKRQQMAAANFGQ